jgi:hypothetical protein
MMKILAITLLLACACALAMGFSPSLKRRVLEFLPNHRTIIAFLLLTLLWVGVGIGTFFAAEFVMNLIEKVPNWIRIQSKLSESEFKLSWTWLVSLYFSLLVTLMVVQKTYRWFFVNVPEFMALITVNYFDGALRKMESGLHLKYPWEQIKKSMWFTLEMISVVFKDDYPTKDGGVVEIAGVFRYRANFKRLERYASIDETTIGAAILNDAKRLMSERIGQTRTEDIASKLQEIKKQIEETYQATDNPLEKSLGIDFEDISIGTFAFGTETRNALDALLKRKLVLDEAKDPTGALILLGKENVSRHENKVTVAAEGGLKGADPVVLTAMAAMTTALGGGKK